MNKYFKFFILSIMSVNVFANIDNDLLNDNDDIEVIEEDFFDDNNIDDIEEEIDKDLEYDVDLE